MSLMCCRDASSGTTPTVRGVERGLGCNRVGAQQPAVLHDAHRSFVARRFYAQNKHGSDVPNECRVKLYQPANRSDARAIAYERFNVVIPAKAGIQWLKSLVALR